MMWSIGQRVGPYQIKRVFDSGGMGTVYQVYHTAWGLDVAIKTIKPRFLNLPTFSASFAREAEIWANIGLHPNVSTCYYTHIFDGVLCLCGEFVEGGSLQDWIQNRILYRLGTDGSVSLILQIAAGMALGLGWAHQHHLIHQDVKPGNLLLSEDGTPKIADFGLTRAVHSGGSAATTGYTHPYASPEQLAQGAVTTATDVWSWAASVLEMFMGGVSWEAGNVAPLALAELRSRHLRMPGFPTMPESVAALLSRCFAHSPQDRPQVCEAIARELSDIHEQLFDEPITFAECGTAKLAAASLNNRAVSLLQMGRVQEAHRLLLNLLEDQPDHAEGMFNQLLLLAATGRIQWSTAQAKISKATDPKESHLVLERCKLAGQALGAGRLCLPWRKACAVAIEDLPFILIRPKSGEEHHFENERFSRLVRKAVNASDSGNIIEAQRYLRMAQDIQSLSAHPKIAKLANELGLL